LQSGQYSQYIANMQYDANYCVDIMLKNKKLVHSSILPFYLAKLYCSNNEQFHYSLLNRAKFALNEKINQDLITFNQSIFATKNTKI